ncbi:ABC transporter substrate-binding protein [Fundidesulfovibrio putealis]|uniref:ABC transporter substrate-binding protein n=1 Tax=Fundidesulfovibrio putealis TaxID=270496 RepID=UPI00146F9878|nr:ABC transporter substrate-binding protein [Fundidesulfovibrio putealis]
MRRSHKFRGQPPSRHSRPVQGIAPALRRLARAGSFTFLLALSCLLCLHPAQASNSQSSSHGQTSLIRLQLKWKHQFQFAGYYAAIEKGFFAREGLRVELLEGVPGFTPSERLFTGQAEYAVDSTAILLQRQKGRKVVALAAIFQHSPNIVMTRRDSGLTTPQSLMGKRIMFTDPTDPECHAMLANEGVFPKDYTVLPHTWSIDALVNGTVDAMSAYLTNEPFLMEQRGVAPGVIFPNQYAVDFYGDCLTTSEAEITEHPRRVEAFLRAVNDGWRYAMANPEEIANLILARYPTSKSRQELLFEAEAMRKLILPDMVEIGHMNPSRWKHIAQTYERLGMLPADFNMEGLLYPEFKQAREERDRLTVNIFLAATGAMAVLAAAGGVVLLVFNKRLSRMVAERTRELEQSRDFFQNVINSTSDPIFVKDAEHRYVLTNDSTALLFGRKPQDVVGLTDFDIFPQEHALAIRVKDEAVRDSGREDLFEECLPDSTGAMRNFLTRKTPYTDSSGRAFILGVVRDITEFKRMQDMVVQAEKMMSLGGLAAGMAHEINNPLGIVMQSAQNLHRRLFESLDANRQAAEELGLDRDAMTAYMRQRGILDAVSDIREAGQRAAAIVKNMLEFSRKSESGKEPCDLAAITENVLGIVSSDYDLAKRYDFKKIDIRKDYSPQSFPVPCSRTKIGQVILNILKNAVQAMSANTQAAAPRLSIRIRPEGDFMRLDLEDNGPGMDEAVRKRIFEPFFTTKGTGEGTGLGMFVSYSIVSEHHGGQLLVDSAPGQGTTFSILLPREPAA